MRYLTLTCCLLLGAVFAASAAGKVRGRRAYADFTAAVMAFTGMDRARARFAAAEVFAASLIWCRWPVRPVPGHRSRCSGRSP